MLRSIAPNTLLVSVLALGLGLAACGGDDGDEGPVGEGESSGDGDPSGDGDGDPSGDGDPTTTGDGDGDPTTTGDGDGDPTTTGDGDGDPSGDGDGDPTTTGDGDGDPSGDGDGEPMFDDATYTITLMPGPPDRLTIRRVSNSEPSCTHMVLRAPTAFDSFDITISGGWAIEEALVWRQGFCPMDLSNPHGEPTMGTGTITFSSYDALMTYPCTIDFDAEIDYATDPPSSGTWKKNGVPVTGVNCG